jgi:hypothetical protein
VDQGGKGLSRRDLVKRGAKAGVAGAAVVWIAPHFEDVAYAAGSTGSPPPGTSTTTRKHQPAPEYPTCLGDPRVLFELPHSIHVWGSGWAPSSKITVTLVGVKNLGTITVAPNGKFDAHFTLPAGLHADQLYRISFSGYGKNGHPYKCGVAIFVDQRCKGAVLTKKVTGKGNPVDPKSGKKGSSVLSGGGANNGGDPGGGGSGALPFTGADSRSLVLIGAGALIAGKTLYSLRNRVAAAADGDLALR